MNLMHFWFFFLRLRKGKILFSFLSSLSVLPVILTAAGLLQFSLRLSLINSDVFYFNVQSEKKERSFSLSSLCVWSTLGTMWGHCWMRWVSQWRRMQRSQISRVPALLQPLVLRPVLGNPMPWRKERKTSLGWRGLCEQSFKQFGRPQNPWAPMECAHECWGSWQMPLLSHSPSSLKGPGGQERCLRTGERPMSLQSSKRGRIRTRGTTGQSASPPVQEKWWNNSF